MIVGFCSNVVVPRAPSAMSSAQLTTCKSPQRPATLDVVRRPSYGMQLHARPICIDADRQHAAPGEARTASFFVSMRRG